MADSACTSIVAGSFKRKGLVMEWSDLHNLQLAREVRSSEPYRFKSRTVERGKIWQEIVNRLNESTLVKFSVSKRSVRDHFQLIHDKYKAKRKREDKLSGVDIKDSEFDILMEEIYENMEEAEIQDACMITNKQKAEADRASGEEIRKKACENLSETNTRKDYREESKPKKFRRNGNETLEFLREKLAVRQAETEKQTKLQEKLLATQQQQQQSQMLTMMQQQNQGVLALMEKLAQK